MKYLFYLGRDATLSMLEIASFLKRKKYEYQVLKIIPPCMFVEVKGLSPEKDILSLGGVRKIAKPIDDLGKHLEWEFSRLSKKNFTYGISVVETNAARVKDTALTIKTTAKREKIKAMQRYVSEAEIAPSKAKGLDMELMVHKGKIYHVCAVLSLKDLRTRDENRPYFDALKVTSLRLAKILVNLSQPKKQAVLVDPFVGLGSIAQEAMLLQCHVVGTDKSQPTVQKCRTNLAWLKKKYALRENMRIANIPVNHLSNVVKEADAVVTEPYLGPYIRKLPKEEEARKVAKELAVLYEQLLRETAKILKKSGKAVIIVPTFKTRSEKIIRIGFETLMGKYGFRSYTPLEHIKTPIAYNPPGAKIRRKIYILERFK